MKISEFKQRDIRTIRSSDLNIVLNTTFNKKIRDQIIEELKRRDTEKYRKSSEAQRMIF